jgi:hypothetical protein
LVVVLLVAVTPPVVEELASASFDKRLKLGQSKLNVIAEA